MKKEKSTGVNATPSICLTLKDLIKELDLLYTDTTGVPMSSEMMESLMKQDIDSVHELVLERRELLRYQLDMEYLEQDRFMLNEAEEMLRNESERCDSLHYENHDYIS